VASDRFWSGTYIQPLWKELHFEGYYFGESRANVAHMGASWLFRLKSVELAPGFGMAFGSNGFATTPAVTFRWAFEKRWFVTQGMLIQCLRDTPTAKEEDGEATEDHASENSMVRPTISDGSHISARWRRMTVGATGEHIHFREGDEWKGGGRLAVRLTRHISAILYVLGPGRAEFRAGLLIHPGKTPD
jgi:hypothetical protein